MATPITGKVARILNERDIALNIGSDKGVSIGMFFDVLDTAGEEIRDPETNELLGSVDRVKVRVKVTRVQEKLSVASTFEKIRVNTGGEGVGISTFSSLLMPPKYVVKYKTLRLDEATRGEISESQSYVKIGDPVEQVLSSVDESVESS
jgi:hypothetical protein